MTTFPLDVEMAASFGDALRKCRRMQTLGIWLYFMSPLPPSRAFKILVMLAPILSEPVTRLPDLHTLSITIHGTPLEFVRGCGTVWKDVAHALQDRSRYPSFSNMEVVFEYTTSDESPPRSPAPGYSDVEDLLRAFEEHSVRGSVVSIV